MPDTTVETTLIKFLGWKGTSYVTNSLIKADAKTTHAYFIGTSSIGLPVKALIGHNKHWKNMFEKELQPKKVEKVIGLINVTI